MNGKEIIKDIQDAVNDVKQKNEDVISVDALLNYLAALENDVSGIDENNNRQHLAKLEEYRAENERNIAHYNAQQLHAVEMFRSVISYGAAALKSSILINGGAAVALLAFIGNVWNKGLVQASVTPLMSAIVYFSFGVLAAAIGTAASYLTQYCYGEEHNKTGTAFHVLTVICVIGAYAMFSFGVLDAHEAFTGQFSPSQ